MTNKKRIQLTLILADMLLGPLAVILAALLRFAGSIQPSYMPMMPLSLFAAAVTLPLFGLCCGSYSSVWLYIGFPELARQAVCAGLSALVMLIVKYTGLYPFSGSIAIIYALLACAMTSGVRSLPRIARWYRARHGLRSGEVRRVVVIGAGDAAAMLIKRLSDSPEGGLYPVAVLDDAPDRRGMRIAGVRVCGATADAKRVAEDFCADEAIIAIPSASADEIRAICDRCRAGGLKVRILQDAVDMERFLAGDIRALREVSLENLLFRDSVRPDMTPVNDFLCGKTVLVTGGAGSIGSELCRQALLHGCEHLVVFDISENGLFEIGNELKANFPTASFSLRVGSVRDSARLDGVFAEFRPEVVFHAAAHKHVPMMELNPLEAVKNNVFGTRNVLACCAARGVRKCIVISTDKAVNPTSVMGATKRLTELILQTMNGRGGCEMAAVRFGNVLGSAGSVVPTFQRQIAAGGPVTVTHPDMKRYFMMIPEAVSLVLSAGALAHGGEVFVLDMGKPVRIYDLAVDLIRLSGREPGKDIPIVFTGLRPGEKLFEEISLHSVAVDSTTYDKIFVLRGGRPDEVGLLERLDRLDGLVAAGCDGEEMRCAVFAALGRTAPGKDGDPAIPPAEAGTAGRTAVRV